MDKKQFSSDIDIDFGNRDQILSLLKHTPATLMRDGKPGKHASGVYLLIYPWIHLLVLLV